MNKDDELKLERNPDFPSQMNAREKIVNILTKVETRQAFSDKLMDSELKDLEDADRRFVTEIVNGVLRWRERLDWYLNQLYMGEFENLLIDVRNNLRSSVYQLKYMEKIPPYAVLFEAVEIAKAKYNQKTANLVNAILRNYLRQQKKFDVLETQLDVLERTALKFSHPKWLVQRWIEYWGIDEVSMLCEANNKPPRLAVRLNAHTSDKEIFFKSLDENGIRYQVHPNFSNFVWIDNFQEFRKLDFLIKGWVSVQDVSTGIPVLLLDPQPGENILDMCAAPGGKTGFIAEKMNNDGFLLALDRHVSRIRLTRDNLERMEFSKFHLMTADSRYLPTRHFFDKVLVDAPCSGFGVVNKRVDLKWKRTEQDILNMKNIQLELLDSAAAAVKPGGIVVYSTCTIEPEENEKVVEAFLNSHPNFKTEDPQRFVPNAYLDHYYVRTFNYKHSIDGSFAARLLKIAAD